MSMKYFQTTYQVNLILNVNTLIEILVCFKCVKEINSISCIWIVFWGFHTQCFSNIYRLKNCVAELFLQIGFIIKRHLFREVQI
jgi:tRNA (Thr-GGU) A37 N-methylase